MENIGQKLKNARKSRGLSIDDLCEKTKIRPHVVEAFENNDFSILPAVYTRSFLKTLFKELKIKDEIVLPDNKKVENKTQDSTKNNTENSDIIPEDKKVVENPLKDEFKKKETKKTFGNETESEVNYTEIFKKRKAVKDYKPNLVNYIIYSVIGLVIIIAIYFSFFHSMFFDENTKNNSITDAAEDSAVVISSENKDLFSNFIPEKPDSIILRAKALDTAWLSIEIDGKTSEQMLMKPGMEKRWSAKEYFSITQGNTGALEYTRNNQLLYPL
jgi:transcriptional regulator with XRE-family HTH domain